MVLYTPLSMNKFLTNKTGDISNEGLMVINNSGTSQGALSNSKCPMKSVTKEEEFQGAQQQHRCMASAL